MRRFSIGLAIALVAFAAAASIIYVIAAASRGSTPAEPGASRQAPLSDGMPATHDDVLY